MEFLYRYYHHFYKLHRRDQLAGINKNIPWFSAVVQLSFGMLCLVLGLYWGLAWLFGASSGTWGVQKPHIFLLLPICFLAWYYLLFNLLKVDKISGTTDLFDVRMTKQNTLLYWALWLGSISLPLVVAALRTL